MKSLCLQQTLIWDDTFRIFMGFFCIKKVSFWQKSSLGRKFQSWLACAHDTLRICIKPHFRRARLLFRVPLIQVLYCKEEQSDYLFAALVTLFQISSYFTQTIKWSSKSALRKPSTWTIFFKKNKKKYGPNPAIFCLFSFFSQCK